MPTQPAARVSDQVQHSQASLGRGLGAVVGGVLGIVAGAVLVVGAVAVLGALEVATGGLATPLVVGAVYVGAAFLAAGTTGMATSAFSNVGADIGAKSVANEGPIVSGVVTILIGPERRAAAHIGSNVACLKHKHGPPTPADTPNPAQEQVSQGSATVLLGPSFFPASRIGDGGTCGFKIGQGCVSVLIGGPTVGDIGDGDDPYKSLFDTIGYYSGWVALAGVALVAAPEGLLAMVATGVGAYLIGGVIGEGLQMLPEGLPRDAATALLTVLPLAGGPKAFRTVSRKGFAGMRRAPMETLSGKGNIEASYKLNKIKEQQALAKGETESARGYRSENQVIDELGSDVVKAGEKVEYTNNNGVKRNTDIDVETHTEVIQIKSGDKLPSPKQMEASQLHAKAVGKDVSVMYNSRLVPESTIRQWQKQNPGIKLIPKDFGP